MTNGQPAPAEHTSVAAVDLGSNSFHMIVAQPAGGHLRIIDRMREPVRLAAGLDSDNRLAESARDRALECLQRFGQRLRHLPPGSVRVVGTNTLRKAREAQAFIAAANEALGHPVEVIAGREEARLIYLGVSHSLPDSGNSHLVVDIGGGSTEVIIGRRFEARQRESLYMGCVSYSRQFFPNGRVSAAAMEKAVLAARLELEPVENEYRSIGWGDAIGASGTIKAVRQVVEQMGWASDGITADALAKLRQALVTAGDVEKVELQGLKPDRRPVLAGGVAVLSAIFDALAIDRMQVSDWALREGVLYDLVGRIRHEDVRERTIATMAERFSIDPRQAQRVERSALSLLEHVKHAWKLDGGDYSSLLGWAAQLHELGLAIAHNQHHKHAAYVLENSDMPGFSREEQSRLALLVRAHRRKFPIATFKAFPKAEVSCLIRLAALLRIAVDLHRSRSEQVQPEPVADADGKRLRLAFVDDWLASHPLTRADLEVEAELLRSARLELSFA